MSLCATPLLGRRHGATHITSYRGQEDDDGIKAHKLQERKADGEIVVSPTLEQNNRDYRPNRSTHAASPLKSSIELTTH
jgi:hypothetical protein